MRCRCSELKFIRKIHKTRVVGHDVFAFRSFFSQPLQNVLVAEHFGLPEDIAVGNQPIFVRVFDAFEMTPYGRRRDRPLIPKTPVRVSVSEAVEVPPRCRLSARREVPPAPVLVRVLQAREMSFRGGVFARPPPCAPEVRMRPFQDVPPPLSSSSLANAFIRWVGCEAHFDS